MAPAPVAVVEEEGGESMVAAVGSGRQVSGCSRLNKVEDITKGGLDRAEELEAEAGDAADGRRRSWPCRR